MNQGKATVGSHGFSTMNMKVIPMQVLKLNGWRNKIVHPGRLSWNLQITHLERKMIFQASMLMFHVNLQGCST